MVTELAKYKIHLNSNLEEITRVEQLVDQIKDDLNLSDDIYGNIIVALTEAVNNAIIHGNKMEGNKKTEISVAKDEHSIIFYVKDQGQGFDYTNLPDPTAPENIEKPTGRGVFLMKNLADLVVFSDGGSQVELQFKL
jgi:serine/threonine-protein kinase RsbW